MATFSIVFVDMSQRVRSCQVEIISQNHERDVDRKRLSQSMKV